MIETSSLTRGASRGGLSPRRGGHKSALSPGRVTEGLSSKSSVATSSLLRRHVRAPSTESGDFRLALAQERLAENAEHDRSIAQHDFTDGQSRRFREQDPRRALDGNV